MAEAALKRGTQDTSTGARQSVVRGVLDRVKADGRTPLAPHLSVPRGVRKSPPLSRPRLDSRRQPDAHTILVFGIPSAFPVKRELRARSAHARSR